ncbi:MAG TPA: OB-fold domain-containing protein [Acidimicrobiia bacterium]|nr:OB-fold domain-containing protein [Acidimicrobiia bacterium]
MTTVDPTPAPLVPVPEADEDSQFYWDGLRGRRLLVQRCTQCARYRFPPMPACPSCAAPGGDVVEIEPRGTVYSWIVVHRAFTPAFRDDVPYVIAVIDLPEGCRLLARLEHRGPIEAGSPVTGSYVDHGTWTELRFRVTS